MTLSEKPFLRKLHLTILYKLSITLIHIRNVFRIDRFVFLIISYSRERVSRCIYELLTRSLNLSLDRWRINFFRWIDGGKIRGKEEAIGKRNKRTALVSFQRFRSSTRSHFEEWAG